jgi:hypothetical protein
MPGGRCRGTDGRDLREQGTRWLIGAPEWWNGIEKRVGGGEIRIRSYSLFCIRLVSFLGNVRFRKAVAL